MHALEFLEYANMASDYAVDGELCVGMQFSNREAIAQAIKNYIISKLMDYYVCELEPKTFHCKYKHYSMGCNWLAKVCLRKKKDVWEV